MFASVHPLPSPMLQGNSEKYKKIDSVYGTPTTERDRPSLQASGDRMADDDIKHLLNASRVHNLWRMPQATLYLLRSKIVINPSRCCKTSKGRQFLCMWK